MIQEISNRSRYLTSIDHVQTLDFCLKSKFQSNISKILCCISVKTILFFWFFARRHRHISLHYITRFTSKSKSQQILATHMQRKKFQKKYISLHQPILLQQKKKGKPWGPTKLPFYPSGACASRSSDKDEAWRLFGVRRVIFLADIPLGSHDVVISIRYEWSIFMVN